MKEIEINGAEMTHRKFKMYLEVNRTYFESTTNVLIGFEKSGDLLSMNFCNVYLALLKSRLSFCIVCSEYYRAMAERSFWFMKPLVMRRVRKYESFHYETLSRLLLLENYIKIHFDGEEEDNS